MLLVAAGPPLGAGDSVIITRVLREQQGVRATVVAYKQCAAPNYSPVSVHVVRLPRFDGPARFDEDTILGRQCTPPAS